MRVNNWLGANVTIPYKEAILPLLDEIHPSADQAKAVNTILNRDGHLVGHNTDLQGFMRDLRIEWQPQGTGRSLILGAGGGARAVAFGLAEEGHDLLFIARTAARVERVVEKLRRDYAVEVEILPWREESFVKATSRCSLIVNATPLGMTPNSQISPWPDDVPLPPTAFIYDLVYAPRDTRLVQQARQVGLQAVSGAGMLLEQAALSFKIWTGHRAPRVQMRKALEKALMQSRFRERSNVPNEVLDA
jgi:shikimate dehydrogenase